MVSAYAIPALTQLVDVMIVVRLKIRFLNYGKVRWYVHIVYNGTFCARPVVFTTLNQLPYITIGTHSLSIVVCLRQSRLLYQKIHVLVVSLRCGVRGTKSTSYSLAFIAVI